MYQRILLAVDGSHSADLALDQAIVIAQAMGAEVKALYVVDDADMYFEPSYFDPYDLASKLAIYGREVLDTAAAKLDKAGVRHTTQLEEKPIAPGQISSTIVANAESWKADLIIMGTHGRRGFRRMLMGSVSEGVLSKASTPLLLVRSEREG